MLKRMISSVLVASMCLSFAACGATAAQKVSYNPVPAKGMVIKVGGNRVDLKEAQPVIINGSTLVPIRFISEAMKQKVTWDDKTKTAIINGNIKITIGAETAKVKDKDVTLRVPAQLLNSRTYVPLRFIGENLNCTVDYFPQNKFVIICSKKTDGSEIDWYERCKSSELFYECYPFKNNKDLELKNYHYLAPKCNMNSMTDAEAEKNIWHIELPPKGDPSAQTDIYIRTSDYSLKVRRQIKGYLQVFYPTGYESVYEHMFRTLRQELWERFYDDCLDSASGTFGTRYYDNREVDIRFGENRTGFYIAVNKTGFINPLKPWKLTPEQQKYWVNNGATKEPDQWFINYWQLNQK